MVKYKILVDYVTFVHDLIFIFVIKIKFVQNYRPRTYNFGKKIFFLTDDTKVKDFDKTIILAHFIFQFFKMDADCSYFSS